MESTRTEEQSTSCERLVLRCPYARYKRTCFFPPAATGSVSSLSSSPGSSTPTEQAVEKSVHMDNGNKMDFSSSIRAEVAKEHKDMVLNLEVRVEI